jgi:putative membrane protein
MKSTHFISAVGVAALCMLGAPVYAQNMNLNQHDLNFVQNQARANIAEIELGRVAQQKATTPMVKDFANRMVQDHTKLNDQLKTWAAQNHVSLPTAPSQAALNQKAKLDQLSGNAFDKAYMMDMLTDHRHDVKQVQRMAENATNPQVKQLAAQVLPTLQDHLRLAEHDAGEMHLPSTKGLNHAGEATRTGSQQ